MARTHEMKYTPFRAFNPTQQHFIITHNCLQLPAFLNWKEILASSFYAEMMALI